MRRADCIPVIRIIFPLLFQKNCLLYPEWDRRTSFPENASGAKPSQQLYLENHLTGVDTQERSSMRSCVLRPSERNGIFELSCHGEDVRNRISSPPAPRSRPVLTMPPTTATFSGGSVYRYFHFLYFRTHGALVAVQVIITPDRKSSATAHERQASRRQRYLHRDNRSCENFVSCA